MIPDEVRALMFRRLSGNGHKPLRLMQWIDVCEDTQRAATADDMAGVWPELRRHQRKAIVEEFRGMVCKATMLWIGNQAAIAMAVVRGGNRHRQMLASR